jgi:hypothetical protein
VFIDHMKFHFGLADLNLPVDPGGKLAQLAQSDYGGGHGPPGKEEQVPWFRQARLGPGDPNCSLLTVRSPSPSLLCQTASIRDVFNLAINVSELSGRFTMGAGVTVQSPCRGRLCSFRSLSLLFSLDSPF